MAATKEGENFKRELQVSDAEAFEHYYTRAAVRRHDRLIDYWDYNDFSQCSKLPQFICDKVWIIVNRRKSETGVLIGREEFFEALQLISLAQKYKKEGLLVDFANELSDCYDKEILPILDLPNVPPPDMNIIPLPDINTLSQPSIRLDPCGDRIIFAPSDSFSREDEVLFPTKTLLSVRPAFNLYLFAGENPYSFRGKSFPRLTIRLPIEGQMKEMVFIPPTHRRENSPQLGAMKEWEDLPEEIRKLVVKELHLHDLLETGSQGVTPSRFA